MSLYNYIVADATALADFNAGNDQSVVDFLNTPSEEQRFTTRRGLDWLSDNFTLAESRLILGTIQGATDPMVIAAEKTMAAQGIDLSRPTVQSLIDALADGANWDATIPGLRTKLKEFGVKVRSPSDLELGRDAALQDVADIRRDRDLTERLQRNVQAAQAAIDDGTATTYDAVLAIMGQV